MASELGAGVVSTPAVGSNEVISRGVVDGHLGLSGDGLMAFQLLSYTKSRTKFSKGLYTSSFSLVVNKEKWAEISAEDQAAIMEISGAKLGMAFGAKWDAVAESVYSTFDELGIPILDADPAFEQAFVDAAAPQVAAWIEKANASGLDAETVLAFYKQRVAELSK
jgi:TRAP-type C4-dicarboxylate transport system substrate-binding protein